MSHVIKFSIRKRAQNPDSARWWREQIASPEQNDFFARAAIVNAGKNIIFRDNNGYKQRLGSPVPNEDNFPTFSLGLEFLNEAEKEKTMEKETRHQRRHDSLHCPRVKCNKLWQKGTGKTKQMTNWSVSTFKGKLKVFRFKIVKYKTRAINRKIEIKPVPISLTAKKSLLILSIFRVGFDAQFHRLCYKTIGSCFSVHYTCDRVMEHLESLESTQEASFPGGGGDSHMKQTGMLVGNFEFNP